MIFQTIPPKRPEHLTKSEVWSNARWLSLFAGLPAEFLTYLRPPLDVLRWFGLLWIATPLLFIRRNQALLFWWLWLVCGMTAVAVSDLLRESLTIRYPRYTIAVSPVMYALTPLLFWHLNGGRRHVLPAVVVVACALALPSAQFYTREDWRPVGQFIATHLGPDNIRIMYDDGSPRDWRTRCDLQWMMYYDHSPRGAVVFLHTPPTPSVEARIRAARAVWFFAPLSQGRVETIVRGARVLESHDYPMIGTLQRIEMPPTAPPATLGRLDTDSFLLLIPIEFDYFAASVGSTRDRRVNAAMSQRV